MTFVWQWPQLTLCALVLICAAVDVTRDAYTGKHSVSASIFGNVSFYAVLATLLYYGGFFTEVRP